MAGYKYMFSAINYIKNVVPVSKPIQNPQCLPSNPLIHRNGLINQQKEICTDCPSYNEMQKSIMHDWNDKVLLLVGTPKGIDENIMRLGIKEGVKQIAILDIDKANGEALQHMFCHEYKDGYKVKYVNCDKTNERQLSTQLLKLLRNHTNSHVIVNNVDFLTKSQEEIDSNMTCFTNISLTAYNLMRTDNAGMGGAFINMVALSPTCPYPDMPICSASRTMDIILSSTLGLDHEQLFLKTGVRVLTVCYGASDSDEITSIQTKTRINPMPIQSSQSLGKKTKCAAQAVIDIFKYGNNGTTWLTRETKIAEDITHVARKSHRTADISRVQSDQKYHPSGTKEILDDILDS